MVKRNRADSHHVGRCEGQWTTFASDPNQRNEWPIDKFNKLNCLEKKSKWIISRPQRSQSNC